MMRGLAHVAASACRSWSLSAGGSDARCVGVVRCMGLQTCTESGRVARGWRSNPAILLGAAQPTGARGRGAQAAAAAGMRVVVVPSVPDRGAYPQACPDAESGAAWAARAPGLGYMVGLGFRAPPLP